MTSIREVLKGKLKKLFDQGDLEGVIEYCRENDIQVRPVLEAFREKHGVSVEETNRVRTRLFRRRDYREGRLQDYVKKRHQKFDFTAKKVERHANGTRKWTPEEYSTFLSLQKKGVSEVDIAKALKTNLRMVKYLRLKYRLVQRLLEKKGVKPVAAKVTPLMGKGDRTLQTMIDQA